MARAQPASKAIPKSSPLHRSNTTPGALSPIRQTFETPEPTDRSAFLVRNHSAAHLVYSYPIDSPVPDHTHQQPPVDHNELSNQLSESEDPPFFTPPHSPPHLTLGLSPHPNTNTSIPNPTTSTPSPVTNTPTTSYNPTISIARQISITRRVSITRRQRQFHVPFNSNNLERLVDRRPMTPTLVNVRSRSSSAPGVESGLGHGRDSEFWHVVRKSQRVVVECVEG